jgi:hypothetical protein
MAHGRFTPTLYDFEKPIADAKFFSLLSRRAGSQTDAFLSSPVNGSQTAEIGNIATGVFTPVLAKHSKSFSLLDSVSVGIDRMQRNFEPMRPSAEVQSRGFALRVS